MLLLRPRRLAAIMNHCDTSQAIGRCLSMTRCLYQPALITENKDGHVAKENGATSSSAPPHVPSGREPHVLVRKLNETYACHPRESIASNILLEITSIYSVLCSFLFYLPCGTYRCPSSHPSLLDLYWAEVCCHKCPTRVRGRFCLIPSFSVRLSSNMLPSERLMSVC